MSDNLQRLRHRDKLKKRRAPDSEVVPHRLIGSAQTIGADARFFIGLNDSIDCGPCAKSLLNSILKKNNLAGMSPAIGDEVTKAQRSVGFHYHDRQRRLSTNG
jgi:hypothetical protein